jgi:hypothetical protein
MHRIIDMRYHASHNNIRNMFCGFLLVGLTQLPSFRPTSRTPHTHHITLTSSTEERYILTTKNGDEKHFVSLPELRAHIANLDPAQEQFTINPGDATCTELAALLTNLDGFNYQIRLQPGRA